MIPNLGKHQAPELVEEQLTVTNPVSEKSEARGEMLPLDLIFKILDNFSLNGWLLMNELSKGCVSYMKHHWIGLLNLPYPEQARYYFQGRPLQDHLCSLVFLEFQPFGIHAGIVTQSTKFEENSLSSFEPQTFLTENEKKIQKDPNFSLMIIEWKGKPEEEKIKFDEFYQSFKKSLRSLHGLSTSGL